MLLKLGSRLLLSFLLVLLPVFAIPGLSDGKAYAAKARHIKDADWKAIINDKEINYKDLREEPLKPKTDQNKSGRWLDGLVRLFTSGIVKTIFIVAVVLAVGYVVYKLLIDSSIISFRKAKKLNEDESELLSEEATFFSTDWSGMAAEAKNTGELALSLRYSYMYVLQRLAHRGLLHYTPDKSNKEYAQELKDEAMRAGFKKITQRYEYAYYGHYPVTEADYADFIHQYESFTSRLK